ncbi:MAG: quinoprotein dehydrogenase-associated putative ABC transporter substrate-binding protein [Gammaproteobacteria bacterium]
MRWIELRQVGVAIALTLSTACALPDAVAERELRVCADPNNLPFSHRDGSGFENRIVELIARELGASVRYTWWPQRRGMLRNTLEAGACDVVPGIASEVDVLATTRPYYRSSYVFVARRDDPLAAVSSFDDSRLRTAIIGVQLIGDDGANPPPAQALAQRGIVASVRGFTVYGDYSSAAPQAGIIDAVASGEIGVAIAWGPTASWFAQKATVPLHITPVVPQQDPAGGPMAFGISMGLRREDRELLKELDEALQRNAAAIMRILDEAGVPLVGEEK